MDFYQSRKFWFEMLSLIAALVVAFIPVMFDMSVENAKTFREMVPYVLGLGFAVIGGHWGMDMLSMAKGVQVPSVDEAVDGVIDAIKNP
jgi:hypothetical protein